MNKSRKAIIKLGYSCNNNCIFCHAIPKRAHSDLSLKIIKMKIEALKDLGIDLVVFSGGEPTVRGDILNIIRYANTKGFFSGIVTNGRMMQYSRILSEMSKSGLRYVQISLHGPENVHNLITRAIGFKQTLKGIRNISDYEDIELVVNCVVNRLNMKSLEEVIDILQGIRINRVKFSLLEPTDKCRDIVPDIMDAWERVKSALEYGKKKGFSLSIDGFPLCIIDGYETHIDDLRANNILYMSEVFDEGFYPSDQGNKVKEVMCRECKLNEMCGGTYREYFSSMQKTILNSKR